MYDPGSARGLSRIHDPGFVRNMGSARGFSRIYDPPEHFQGYMTQAPPENFEANFSYGYEKLAKKKRAQRRKNMSKSKGRQREATNVEPKSAPQGPILKRRARTQKSRLCLGKNAKRLNITHFHYFFSFLFYL